MYNIAYPELLMTVGTWEDYWREVRYISAARRALYREAYKQGWADCTRKAVLNMYKMNMPVTTIAEVMDITESEALAIIGEQQF